MLYIFTFLTRAKGTSQTSTVASENVFPCLARYVWSLHIDFVVYLKWPPAGLTTNKHGFFPCVCFFFFCGVKKSSVQFLFVCPLCVSWRLMFKWIWLHIWQSSSGTEPSIPLRWHLNLSLILSSRYTSHTDLRCIMLREQLFSILIFMCVYLCWWLHACVSASGPGRDGDEVS